MNVQPEWIPGIYNFCDSWCERCLFTARCGSYQTQLASKATAPADPNATLVAQLTQALELTKQYLARQRDRGAPANATALETRAVAADSLHQRARQHPTAQLAQHYLQQTGAWLSAEKDLLERAGYAQLNVVNLGLRTEHEALNDLNALKDAYEMIRWYRTLIPVKTVAAIRGITDNVVEPPLLAYHLGKAKLVLVSIDRSLAAWQTVLAHAPERSDDWLDMPALLSRLRRELEALLPNARAFQRPGLD